MKAIFFVSLFAFCSTGMACPLLVSEKKALQAALLVEGLNGGAPLTYETQLTSKLISGWRVILSYSGVQRSYLVGVESRTCRITEVGLEH